jgi:hypothetical protein
MKKLFLLLTAGILMAACSNTGNNSQSNEQAGPNEVVITNDMENASGIIPSWHNEKSVIAMQEPPAHSGEYACVTNDTNEFSYSYTELFKNIRTGVPKMAALSGWVYTTVANPNFEIICNINDDTLRYEWKAFPLDKELSETGKWVEFSSSFIFDKPLKPEQEIALVAWNQSKKAIYLDDLKITFSY